MPTSLPSKYSGPATLYRARNCVIAARPAAWLTGLRPGRRQSRQRTGLGWQEKPMLEQTGAAPSAPRAQLTQSSVHRLQFGGPVCTETPCGGAAGFGISISAASLVAAARTALTDGSIATAKTAATIGRTRRILVSCRAGPKRLAGKTNGRNEVRPL
jgi:hypothetical protein